MNFGELKTLILARSHRTDLTSEAPRFVSECEGLIAREVRAREMITRTTIVEGDRVSEGIYSLPADFLEERVLRIGTNPPLTKRPLGALNNYATSGNVCNYAILGGNNDIDDTGGEIEFRAVPATDAEIELIYFGLTRFSDDADDNALLVNHEDLYVQGSLAFLFQHAQELELAQAALDTFTGIATTLNRQASRYFGGTTNAAPYNLGVREIGRGY